MKLFKVVAALLIAGTLGACTSGGNGGGAGELSHNELAGIFVSELNASGQYHVSLAKTSTEQYGYIVVLDSATNNYDAIRIEGYTPDQDAAVFLDTHDSGNFYDLDFIPGHYESTFSSQYNFGCDCYVFGYYPTYYGDAYRDRSTGIYFEKTQGTPKDRLKLAALNEAFAVKGMSENLMANYGLSAERSAYVAKLTYLWQQSPKERMTDADHDRFAKEILGHTITEFKAAGRKLMSGDRTELNQLIESSARVNGITPEDANQIVDDLM